ncbi:MAG: sigma-70 family RNA polymerase sigma factor [Lentisphaeraceae bacterium]|nr:sigma-70 family RNA polymerase sigma factor [Lentisphaeraceae bacterium]
MQHFETRASLIFRLKDKQDEKSWDQFVKSYRPYICAVAIGLGVDNADVDDIAQKVVLKAWEKLPDFDYDRNAGRFKNWLAQIVRNIVMTFQRSQKRERNKIQSLEESSEVLSDVQFERLFEKQWKVTIGELAWQNVKDRFSEEVVQCFSLLNKGLKNNEVAEKLNLKPNTVAVYKKRIVSLLQKEIIQLDASLS